MKAYTDYPLDGIDPPNQIAPIREVEPLFYDGDKYVTVLFEGRRHTFKAGYLYSKPGRCGGPPNFDVSQLSFPPEIDQDATESPAFIRYEHFGHTVAVRADLKGRHQDHCLCWQGCSRLHPGQAKNCAIAQALFELDCAAHVITPVWECPHFDGDLPQEDSLTDMT